MRVRVLYYINELVTGKVTSSVYRTIKAQNVIWRIQNHC